MPDDLVIVPSHYRPEYLYLCLERLAQADGGRNKCVRIYQDRHVQDDALRLAELPNIHAVVKRFNGRFTDIQYIEREPHTGVGNTRNFLEAYKRAYTDSWRYVYLVEDDVHVGPDFFKWHEAVQARGDYFCSVAWWCIRNPLRIVCNDPLAYLESSKDFSSIGVCWRRENLSAVACHADDEYYENPSRYVAHYFPTSPIPRGQWTEQAGLIMRVLLNGKGRVVAWADVPRVAHVGIHGYHRSLGVQFSGSLLERISKLRTISCQLDVLKTMSGRPDLKDINTLPEVGQWNPEELYVSQVL